MSKGKYNGYTEARAQAHRRYIASRATIQIVTTEEHREAIKQHVEKTGESINRFIIRAIDETMARDNQQTGSEQ